MNVEEAGRSLFSLEDLQMQSKIDSTLFGFLKFCKPENAEKKSLLIKVIQCLEKFLVENFRNKENDSSVFKQNNKENIIDKVPIILNDDSLQKENNPTKSTKRKILTKEETYVRIFCKLGHFHLLLEDYVKALSAYQLYLQMNEYYWKDIPFMYGLGMVYFHYHEYHWAIKTFHHILYLDPGFSRCNEIHLRLAIMFKVLHDYESALKHFQLVLADTSPSSLSKSEIAFHIGHLYEVEGKYKAAKDTYEQLLKLKDISRNLLAETYKQLGWMHHNVEAFGEKPQRQALALHYLQKSIEADPTNSQSLYFLGRCYASFGKIHDAFVSYRSSVDIAEANADTWCSIGILYAQQNQPMDALQAYICAVQLDKSHTPAWTNLGILYENCYQPQDALKCYVNASIGRGPRNPNLASRVKVLQSQSSTAFSGITQRQLNLPCIEDAWDFSVSQEMASRQNAAIQKPIEHVSSTNQGQTYSRSEALVVAGHGYPNQVQAQYIHMRPSSLISSSQEQATY